MAPATDSSGRGSAPVVRWFRCLVLASIFAGVFVSVAAGKYGGGSGTEADPYLIRTAEDLDLLGSSQGDWEGKSFRLMADIDLQNYNETNFHLIGSWVSWGDTANRAFRGNFDGNRHTISNFHYRDMKQNGIGLFRYADVATIKNLRLENVMIVTDGMDVAPLVGYFQRGAVMDCHVVGADVTGDSRVGGLIGTAEGSVTQCSSRGRVAGFQYVGGLIGYVNQGTIKQSYSKAPASGTDSVGGLIGVTVGSTSIIESCYAHGSVKGTTTAGGLVGQLGAGKIWRCYSTGAVSDGQFVGGLVGKKFQGEVLASYWDAQTSGRTTSAGLEKSKTTDQMWSASTFADWDFDYTWSICEGRNYPVFLWQIPTADLRCPDGVNWIDFVRFAVQWERNDCGAANWDCEWVDFDGSGDVGFPDLAIFAEEWLAGID